MGYTGAVFANFFGGVAGPAISAGMLLLWIVVPAWLGLRAFRRKDF
jgi:Cu-processing system permease protein